MENQQLLVERLRNAEAKVVALLGMGVAIIAIENIDIEFYKKDYFLVKCVEEIIRKHFPFPGKISASISVSRHMANAKRAYTILLINELEMKKRQVAVQLNCGLRNVYNLYYDGLNMLEEDSKNTLFKQRFNMIMHDYKKFIEDYANNRTESTRNIGQPVTQ